MSRYTAEEKQARIAEARDLLRDLDSAAELRAASSSMAEAESERKDHLYRYGIALAKSDGLERRRREAEQLEATREREKKMTDAEQAKKWGQWVDRRIADALAEHTRATEEAVGQALAEERAEQRKRVREQIKIAVGELRTELVKQRGIAEGAIIDLPLFPVPRKRDPHAA